MYSGTFFTEKMHTMRWHTIAWTSKHESRVNLRGRCFYSTEVISVNTLFAFEIIVRWASSSSCSRRLLVWSGMTDMTDAFNGCGNFSSMTKARGLSSIFQEQGIFQRKITEMLRWNWTYWGSQSWVRLLSEKKLVQDFHSFIAIPIVAKPSNATV